MTASQTRAPTLPAAEALRRDLEEALPPGGLLWGEAVTARDPGWNPANLAAGLMARPASAAEAAAVLRIAARHGATVVPQGGRTGLVGGAVSRPGQIILSTERLARIRSIDPDTRVAVVEAGVTLAAVQRAAEAHGLEPGIDIAARGSATIGGMISTNAGGMSAFRHGVMRHRVLGLEAVLPDGRVLSDLAPVIKAALGPDPRHLLIGAEGTLGIVTAAALRLEPRAPAQATALLALPDLEAVPAVLAAALRPAAGHLHAIELMLAGHLAFMQAAHGHDLGPVGRSGPAFLLMSLAGPAPGPLQEALETLAEGLFGTGHIVDALIASSGAQAERLWALREDTGAITRAGAEAAAFDVSVPLSALAGYVRAMEAGLAALDPALTVFTFGHVADGNLHIVVGRVEPMDEALRAAVEEAVYGPLAACGGVFSAEHGIGSKRTGHLAARADPMRLALMAGLKGWLDPLGLMNPGKVLAAPADGDG
ncbi:MAG: FAD-binding oxidoreductase [Alkalilacustris sp.]